MKIAVIGSGFYGSTLALLLSKNHDVELFEKERTIFNGASSSNQFRFHSGYHYPRSQKTVNEINKSKEDFISFFGKKVFEKTANYYPVAKDGKIIKHARNSAMDLLNLDSNLNDAKNKLIRDHLVDNYKEMLTYITVN